MVPCVVMMVGVMAESGRLPGAMELAELCMRPYMLGTPTLEVKSSISLFMRKPRPSMVTPQPKPPLRVVVLATELPSESTMEKWVVSVDSFVLVADGGGGRKPAGRTRFLLGVGLPGSMEARHAAAYFGLAICFKGRVLKSGSPR